ncbi:MAG: sugar ABC transporter permease [Nitrososphaerota archaeon]|nr:sugar ABC transporter permease [Nitrososphaerota archaeon]MDG6979429.1 sugar ABC transporter permease [Nitrososphaerota archaeon]
MGAETRQGRRARESRRWYLLFIPLFVVVGFVEIYPLIESLYISLTNLNGGASLSNYVTMVTTPTFWNALNISLLYSLSSTILAVLIGIGLTFILTQELKGKGIFEAIYILPLAAAPIVVGVLYSPSSVWDDIQQFFHFILHQPYFNELTPSFYFPVMFFSDAWEWSPLIMLVALSIVNSASKEVYEAAELHGASALQKFRMVTLPAVFRSPVMQFVVVLRFIDAMRAFEVPLAWTNWLGYTNTLGSPVDTISLYLYKLLYSSSLGFPLGVVSAVAVSLFVVTLVGALVLLRLMKAVGG